MLSVYLGGVLFLILYCKLFELQIVREMLKLILLGRRNSSFLFLPFAWLVCCAFLLYQLFPCPSLQ